MMQFLNVRKECMFILLFFWKEHQDVSPPIVARIPKSCVTSVLVPSISVAEGETKDSKMEEKVNKILEPDIVLDDNTGSYFLVLGHDSLHYQEFVTIDLQGTPKAQIIKMFLSDILKKLPYVVLETAACSKS
ncbi:unnamed protein product [Prunus armeniaca]|uniref:Uncharacterized protein n=1 Tax=Prunus armeniaca TaxID=36596 RepID=A0A6J5VWP6_PRUAR|nr:unnamed protein product [Prunus armeniaca]